MDYRFKFGLIALSLLIFIATNVTGKATDSNKSSGFGPGEQDWDFVEVRKGAHLFYWLYYTTSPNASKPSDRPLAIWLQGGPGASSTGYGNFEEIGPLDLDLNPRNFTWVKDMNVLFIDSPVGSGFSYVDDRKYLATNNVQVAKDLIELIRDFLEKHPAFKSTPLHIFSESYGGKVAVEFAYHLNKEIEARTIDCNLKSVTSVDGWISPMDSVNSWAPFLFQMGFVNDAGHDAIAAAARRTGDLFNAGKYAQSTQSWGQTERVIVLHTGQIDFYNVLTPTTLGWRLRDLTKTDLKELMFRTLVTREDEANRDATLAKLMKGAVSKALNIPKHVVWGSQSYATFTTHSEEFMKPVIHIVEKLLNETSIDVNIITGQLDLIVATPGTNAWVKKIQWPGSIDYQTSPRNPLLVDSVIEGYYTRHNRFTMYWINRAGHMVPFDNPQAMDYILKKTTRYHELK